MASASVPTPTFDQAFITFDKAFKTFKSSVTSTDAATIQSTTLKEVEDAAKAIEVRQRERKAMRTMARLKPLFLGLEKYSKVVEVVCNGTQYLPWIWAPIKLMLQIAMEVSDVLDTLVNAYSQIADAMPDFNRIGSAFRDTPSVQAVLALIYEDVLEFHRRAYKFLRRRGRFAIMNMMTGIQADPKEGWKIFFESIWKSFEGCRLTGILKNISSHTDFLMKEIQILDIIAAKNERDIAKEQLDEREKKKENTHLHDSIAWLKIADEGQLDALEDIFTVRQRGTCEWVTRNSIFGSWKDDADGEPVIWLNGIPGAGKTVLCSYVINLLRDDLHVNAPFYICNSYTNGKSNLLGEILRSLTAQLLRNNKELAPYIFDKYANTGLTPSIVHLRKLLTDLLETLPKVRMCIDGLDEFPDGEQRKIINELLTLSKNSHGEFRILFSSREVPLIERAMKGRPLISLNAEEKAVGLDIAAYVHDHDCLVSIRENFDENFVTAIEKQVVTKAKGMFLWVRLIMTNFDGCDSKKDIQNAVNELPNGLDEAYGRILDRIKRDIGQRNSQKAIHILQWVACSFRVLKLYEIQDGIVFNKLGAVLDDDSKMNRRILDHCKPLVQEGPNKTVEFVHYSAKEYVLHQTSDHFIEYSKAHHDIALSCVLYLNTSFGFKDASFGNDMKLRVLKGFHGLHHYANEFWFQHLLQYEKSSKEVNTNEEMDVAINNLLGVWKQDPGIAAKAMKLDDTTTKDSIETEIAVLKKSEIYHAIGQDILTLRAFLAQEKFVHQKPDDLKALESKHDSTLLSDIAHRFQGIVQFLINCNVSDLPPGSSPEMLDNFRGTYLDSAFICRYRTCPRFLDGFQTAAACNEHETGHIKPLRCADPLCVYFDQGFNSRTGLAKHNRKFHPMPEEVDPPTFESIKAVPPVYVPPPPRQPTPPHPITPPSPPTFRPPLPPPHNELRSRRRKALRGLPVHHCYMCAKVFTRAEGLRRHELTHSDPTWRCNFSGCPKAFHRKDVLERHLVRHGIPVRDEVETEHELGSTDDDTENVDGSDDVEDPMPELPSVSQYSRP